ncbi:hypothetical protein Y032_0396g667 [Ancylostoma ceylanicum]|uniref:Uncharacterized protein n=1 Tax=Ancylostoma ceylanicum TaxID=53326 RepID=A0A016RS36_9BILA|nr:hypothetical protein Y032_0396g667 [Ancylostoma ceylanicum]
MVLIPCVSGQVYDPFQAPTRITSKVVGHVTMRMIIVGDCQKTHFICRMLQSVELELVWIGLVGNDIFTL